MALKTTGMPTHVKSMIAFSAFLKLMTLPLSSHRQEGTNKGVLNQTADVATIVISIHLEQHTGLLSLKALTLWEREKRYSSLLQVPAAFTPHYSVSFQVWKPGVSLKAGNRIAFLPQPHSLGCYLDQNHSNF